LAELVLMQLETDLMDGLQPLTTIRTLANDAVERRAGQRMSTGYQPQVGWSD
ncbi:MAG: hypothetical protein L6R36_008873, partial [Xanthoria steineri]